MKPVLGWVQLHVVTALILALTHTVFLSPNCVDADASTQLQLGEDASASTELQGGSRIVPLRWNHEVRSPSPTATGYPGVLADSCAYSISLDVQRSCGDVCMSTCGISPGSHASFSMTKDRSRCVDVLTECAIPRGLRHRLAPAGEATDITEFPLLGRANATTPIERHELYTKMDMLNASLASFGPPRFKNYSIRKLLFFPVEDLAATPGFDPYKLTYATVKKNAGGQGVDEKSCTFVTLGWIDDDQNGVWRNDPGAGYTFGKPRNRTAFEYEFDRRVDTKNGHFFTYSPNFAPLIQQFYLRGFAGTIGEEGGAEGESVRRHLAIAFVTANAEVAVEDLQAMEEYGKEEETVYQLETFTALNWRAHVAPECAAISSCESCTITSLCSWCDLSDAPAPLDSDWHAHTRTPHRDGSGCGISPHVCAFMGGTPHTHKCPLLKHPKTLNKN